MNHIWNTTILGNSITDWGIVVLIIAAGFTITGLLKKTIIKTIKKWASSTENALDDFIVSVAEKTLIPLLYTGAVYAATSYLKLPAKADKILHAILMVIVLFFVLRAITVIVKQFIFTFIRKQENSDAKEKQAKGLIIILNIIIWMLGFVFFIDNLGYNITTIIAGLGIGGIAIALAAQTILGDLFSYFVIFFDRPFEIGDFIVVDDKAGVIEYIGVKTTRIRTLNGEQLVCSNTDLTNARLHNYKRLQSRRVVFKLNLVYQTPYDTLKQIPQIVKDIISPKELVRYDRGHFCAYGSSSLDFEFVYYIDNADYNVYMDTHQSILLDIFAEFEKRHLEFAYPTQTLYLQPNIETGASVIPSKENTIKARVPSDNNMQ